MEGCSWVILNALDFSKRRTTDLKCNAGVIFPKTRSFQDEAKFELLRIEAMGAFKNYVDNKCDKWGRQVSNLTKSEQLGLKSLKKRTEEGEIVVLPTDKTGNFAIMERALYDKAGLSHVKGDVEVGWEDLKSAQRELNGHVSMLIKIFRIGSSWNHSMKVRETMLRGALEVCPVHLLYKDHKGWTEENGEIPPTRHVAGGNRGMSLHISEIVSDILEPLVGRVQGGQEVISTEDTIAQLEGINQKMVGWTSTSWWEGVVHVEYVACGNCRSNEEYLWSEDNPDLCRCSEAVEIHDEAASMDGMRCTNDYVRTLRRLEWEKSMDWSADDEDRMVCSTEVLPEDLQNYSVPMVIVGSDVISLYPNLKVEKIVERVEQEVLKTDLKFENVDYLEAARYLVLNWTEKEVKTSGLRRVLPWRRKRGGSKPGITGEGPLGVQRGDQEQWVFPHVQLEDWERKKIVAGVLKLATRAMFRKHFYTFGGKTFQQTEGGPIGLRGTCAVARLVMQAFDREWGELLRALCVRTWGNMRYMDDGRTVMPPFKPGWRWDQGQIRYCLRWEKEDSACQDLRGLEG